MTSARTPDEATLAAVDAKFAEVKQRRREERDAEEAERVAGRKLWLAHHWPHRYERCTVVGGRHVCRRCLWFYGVAFATLALAPLGISPWPTAWDSTLVWILSIPATIDFVLGELTSLKYNARRQVIVSSILGLAVGRGFYAELLDSGSTTFWGPVLVFGPIWFTAAAVAWMRNRGQYREDRQVQKG